MQSIRHRITSLIQALQKNIYEKETEISLALLAAISGETLLLLGPPGVAKSLVARRLKEAFKDGSSFEYLMSRFSTPDEIFGPISINRLKENDVYERSTTGYLPTADVVFLDEIWKAGPAIQNTLLTVMNEKIFRNGNKDYRIPMKLLIAASNELPAHDEGLEALWDRFLLRIVSQSIQDENMFRHMLKEEEEYQASDRKDSHIPEDLTITFKEYELWQHEIQKVVLTDNVLQSITHIRKALKEVHLNSSDIPRLIYISDRRWKHIARLIRTSAFLQGRSTTDPIDLFPMYHALWNEPEEIEYVRNITLQAVFAKIQQQLEHLAQQIKSDLNAHQAQEAIARSIRNNDHRDDRLLIAHRYFYQLENHGTGHSYIYITDYKKLPMRTFGDKNTEYVRGIIYLDKQQKKHQIIRISESFEHETPNTDIEYVTLCRDDSRIYINGVAYKMREKDSATLNPTDGKIESERSNDSQSPDEGILFATHYEEKIETLCKEIEIQAKKIEAHIFISSKEKMMIHEYLKQFNKKIALTRVDLRKLLYDE